MSQIPSPSLISIYQSPPLGNYYLISMKWYHEYLNYQNHMNSDEDYEFVNIKLPTMISNIDLIEKDTNVLGKNSRNGMDYVIVSEVDYLSLYDKYSCDCTILRKSVTIKLYNEEITYIELYPIMLNYNFVQKNGEIPSWEKKSENCKEVEVSKHKIFKDFLVESNILIVPKLLTNARTYGKSNIRVWKLAKNKEDIPVNWKLMGTSFYEKTMGELFENFDGFLSFEKINDDGKYPREKFVEKIFRDFEIGDDVDVCDFQKNWFESTVIDMNATKIKIHYKNWDSKYDDWHDKDSYNLAPLSTRTDGPYVPKNSRN